MSGRKEETDEERQQRVSDGAVLLTGLMAGILHERLKIVELTPNHIVIQNDEMDIKYKVRVEEAKE